MGDSKSGKLPDDEEPEIAPADFLQYKGSKKLKDEDEEDLGHYEQEDYGHDFVQLPGGQYIPVWEYLGAEWDARIVWPSIHPSTKL
jgi:hypothetical protein